jgi:hypothetical protein
VTSCLRSADALTRPLVMGGHLCPVALPRGHRLQHAAEQAPRLAFLVAVVHHLDARGSTDPAQNLPARRRTDQVDVAPVRPVTTVEPMLDM